MLVRVSRNCPWNMCAFCPVYKGTKFSLRSVEDVLADLDEMRKFYKDRPRTVFLQDANPLLTKPDDLVRIIEGVRERFPRVERITAYARSHTLARRSLSDLERIRRAGLDRLHVGMESGCDAVLDLVSKGTTRAEQIEGGRRAKLAGFELSEYVMPGLGGKSFSEAHADDSASALCEIEPDFVRLRTAAVIPRTPLAELEATGDFVPLGEVEMVGEIRRFLSGLGELHGRLESDHILNLLMELKGDLPGDLDGLLDTCDEFLRLPERMRLKFIMARRLGWMVQLADVDQVAIHPQVEEFMARLNAEGVEPEEFFSQMRKRMV